MLKLYRFSEYCGRMGDLEGIFVATQEEIDSLMGQEVNFGEVLGKHSDITCEISEDNIGVLTDDQDFIAKAIEYKLVPTGHNPLDYFEIEDDDYEE